MKSIYTTEVFDAWFGSLRDKQAARRIQARIDRAEEGNFGDCKPVGEGVLKCGFTSGQGIACISHSAAWRLWSYSPAAIKAHKTKTSR
jgi:putative addiction module killer protein